MSDEVFGIGDCGLGGQGSEMGDVAAAGHP